MVVSVLMLLLLAFSFCCLNIFGGIGYLSLLLPLGFFMLLRGIFRFRAEHLRKLFADLSDLKFVEYNGPVSCENEILVKLDWRNTNRKKRFQCWTFYFFPRWAKIYFDADGIHLRVLNGYLDRGATITGQIFMAGFYPVAPVLALVPLLYWMPELYASHIDEREIDKRDLLIPWQEITLACKDKGAIRLQIGSNCHVLLQAGNKSLSKLLFLQKDRVQDLLTMLPVSACATESPTVESKSASRLTLRTRLKSLTSKHPALSMMLVSAGIVIPFKLLTVLDLPLIAGFYILAIFVGTLLLLRSLYDKESD